MSVPDIQQKIDEAAEVAAALPFRVHPDDIPIGLANAAHYGTSWTPERRGYLHQLDYVTTMRETWDELLPRATTEKAKAILISEMETFRDRYLAAARAYLHSHSNVISAAIAGPSNFPAARNEKRSQWASNKLTALLELRPKAIRAITKRLKALAVAEAGGPIEVMKRKLAEAERNHERMKIANKIIRSKKLSHEEKVAKIQADLRFSEAGARQLLLEDSSGRVGIPAWRLTNNNANIRRMRQRIVEMEAAENRPDATADFDGGTVEDSGDRIRIYFDQKPDADTIAQLKGRGFRWSRKEGAWQRMRTDATRAAVAGITGVQL